MTNIKRKHNRIHKHMTSVLKYAVLVISASITATLEAETDPKQSQVQKLSKAQLECLSKTKHFIKDACL